MTPTILGIIGLVVLGVLFSLRIPIAFSMLIVGVIGYSLVTSFNSGISLLGRVPYISAASFELSQIPIFILMGYFLFYSAISSELFSAMYKWLGKLPGGLAVATIGTSAAFASICGSSTATAATVGVVAIPEMNKHGYDSRLSCGSAAAGGVIGIMIPPSITFVIYAFLTEQSVGKLFMAGILPGLLLTLAMMLVIVILVRRNPRIAPSAPSFRFREKVVSLKGTWAVGVIFLVVIGGIYTGLVTATEAASLGCLVAFMIALSRKQLNRQNFSKSLMETINITGMTFLLLIGAGIYGQFLAISEIPMTLSAFVAGLTIYPWEIMVIILIMMLFLGCILDSMTLIVLTVPILYPLVVGLGYDPIWFGVMIVLCIEMGMLTPPIGINVFVISGMNKNIPMNTIFSGVAPFVVACFVCAIILLVFPQIALILPKTMLGGG